MQTIEHRQGFKIACLEEIAWQQGWMTDSEIEQRAQQVAKTVYGRYLLDLLEPKPTTHVDNQRA